MTMQDVLSLVASRKGHFLLESGHHGDLWLDLELLCLKPRSLSPFVTELAARLAKLDVEVICGPLVEGAFIGLMVASELDVRFVYSERFSQAQTYGLFPAGYRLPDSIRRCVQNKRVAIVNDVINAGSAVRGTFAELEACGANPVAIAALLVLGRSASAFAVAQGVALESIASLPNNLWRPDECPLCRDGVALKDAASFKRVFGS